MSRVSKEKSSKCRRKEKHSVQGKLSHEEERESLLGLGIALKSHGWKTGFPRESGQFWLEMEAMAKHKKEFLVILKVMKSH